MPLRGASDERSAGPWNCWRESGEPRRGAKCVDEYTGDAATLPRAPLQRVRDLPAVRAALPLRRRPRALRARRRRSRESPMRVFRRDDVARGARAGAAGDAPTARWTSCTSTCTSSTTSTSCCSTSRSAPTTCRSRRRRSCCTASAARYPAGWDAHGPSRCTRMASVEWLDADGARAGALRRAASARPFSPSSASTARRASPRTGRSLLRAAGAATTPSASGALRYRQIEYYRMPMMAYLALDDPRALTRNDFIRLGLSPAPASRRRRCLPYAEQHLADFEQRYCYDRFWADTGAGAEHALPVQRPRAGGGRRRALEFYRCRDRGVLAQFRHQHFLLFLIAHFQKAALLMFSDRLVEALQAPRRRRPGERAALQARDPRQLRELPALHAPLLVPRGLRAGAGARAVPPVRRRTSASTRSTPRSRSASPT